MTSTSNDQAKSQCLIHRKTKNILCMNPGCRGRRLCCDQCRIIDHKYHVFKEIKDLNSIGSRFEFGRDGSDKQSSIRNSIVKVVDTMNKFPQTCNQLQKYLQAVRFSIPYKLTPAFSYLGLLFEGQLAKHCQTTLSTDHEQEYEYIASLYRFLAHSSIQNQEEVNKIISTVGDRIDSSINKLKSSIQNALSAFYSEVEKCEVKNWYEVYRQKFPIKQKQPHQMARKQYPRKSQIISLIQEENREQQKPMTKFIDRQTEQMIESMLEQLFEVKEVGNSPPLSSLQSEKKNSKRYVLTNTKPNKPILAPEIIGRIRILANDKNYSQNLREFILEGPNEFDIQCLKKLAAFFPKLTKFNYVWNFQQSGLMLQNEQVFFESPRYLEKDMKNFEMSQELLDVYGQFKDLQNISINQVEMFAFKEMKIRNKKILHLTIGDYVQPNQQEILPNCLKNEALLFNGLITLNIFNIKKIDGDFMQKIIDKNLETLRNLWLSECIQLEDSFYGAIKRSKLEFMIFDQVKRINSTIFVPETLKTLIVDNCQLYSSNPFSGLSKAQDLTNFSIFDSVIYEAKEIGDQVLEQISSIPNCKIQYLSIAECKSLTNKSLKYLQTMTMLKDLCIDNTNVCLYQLSRYQKLLGRLRKLGIVGLQVQHESELHLQKFGINQTKLQYSLQRILKNSPNLSLISLKFEQSMANIDISLFKVQHVSISALKDHKQYKKRLLREFVEKLKNAHKKINIV